MSRAFTPDQTIGDKVSYVANEVSIATYANWILIPMLVASGLISLAWGFVTVKQVLDNRSK